MLALITLAINKHFEMVDSIEGMEGNKLKINGGSPKHHDSHHPWKSLPMTSLYTGIYTNTMKTTLYSPI
jgi:hypothetical protein